MYRQYFTMPMLPYFFQQLNLQALPFNFCETGANVFSHGSTALPYREMRLRNEEIDFLQGTCDGQKKMKVFSNPAVALSLYKKKTHAAIIVYGAHTQALPRKLAAHDPR